MHKLTNKKLKKNLKYYIKKPQRMIKSFIEDIALHYKFNDGSFLNKTGSFIRYFIFSPLFQPFYIFYERSKKILAYIPILWNEPEWDSAGMWSILQKKLELLEKVVKKGDGLNGYTSSAEIK